MANLLLLAVCFLAGALARRSGKFPAQTPVVLNAWVMWLALPALILGTIHKVPLRKELLLSAGSLWLVFLVAAVAALLYARARPDRRGTAGALALTAGLGNTAFMGLPLLEALGGKEAVALGVVVDQLGSFLVLSLLAVPFAAHLSGQHASLSALFRRVARFAPFLALLLAVATRPLPFPPALDGLLERLAATLSPIALASVGWQLRLSALRSRKAPLGLGLLYKMAFAPLLAFVVLKALAPSFALLEHVAVAQAAMAPMVTGSLLATEHDLDPELAALLLGVGVPLSLLTVPLVWHLLG